MTTREALLAAILSDPQDDTCRLVYADRDSELRGDIMSNAAGCWKHRCGI